MKIGTLDDALHLGCGVAAILVGLVSLTGTWLFGAYARTAISELLASSSQDDGITQETAARIEHSMTVFSEMNGFLHNLTLATGVIAALSLGINSFQAAKTRRLRAEIAIATASSSCTIQSTEPIKNTEPQR